MILEKRINEVIWRHSLGLSYGSGRDNICDWEWYGSPMGTLYPMYAPVHKIIKQAELAQCLTSPSEYVREYRKWYESRRENK